MLTSINDNLLNLLQSWLPPEQLLHTLAIKDQDREHPKARFQWANTALMFAHQVRGGMETLFAWHEFTLGLEEIDNAFGTEVLGGTSKKP